MKTAERLQWYWNRARAMNGAELAAHLRKKTVQMMDAFRQQDWGAVTLDKTRDFPQLPDPNNAPALLREAIARDAKEILAGRWLAFGHLPLAVDDPPRWHKDYLAGVELQNSDPAFKLDHRALPGGADIKLIWELSRWHALVRLAQAAWLYSDDAAARKCVSWLNDWELHNPPFRGWNWTSGLEAGIRLIQFIWIDALLCNWSATRSFDSELAQLRSKLLPAHVWFTWRNRSFGSSANNHLIGELAGVIVAIARWPTLEKCSAPLAELREMFERELLAQFASDGGNREQALNYHLFSFELCWQARAALASAGIPLSAVSEERLQRAAAFYVAVQVESDQWDYGDSDDGFVTPFFVKESDAAAEWRSWFENSKSSVGLAFWLGTMNSFRHDEKTISPAETVQKSTQALNKPDATSAPEILDDWKIFPETGIAIRREGDWILRWDLSPSGYLATAAHGHLDALHLSIWFRGKAIVVDPGTGAYYADPPLRTYLASWPAHNGPHPAGLDWPRRLGPFLWSEHHPRPTWHLADKRLEATLEFPAIAVRRAVAHVNGGWAIEDSVIGSAVELAVRWQFAPGSIVQPIATNSFALSRAGVSLRIETDRWDNISLQDKPNSAATEERAGLCSPSFRSVEFGPFLRLGARAQADATYTTRFLA